MPTNALHKQCRQCGKLKPHDRFTTPGETETDVCDNCTRHLKRKPQIELKREKNLRQWHEYHKQFSALAGAKTQIAATIKAASVYRRQHLPMPAGQACAHCTAPAEHGHHASYAFKDWLNVTWLCKPCHETEHQRLRRKGLSTALWKTAQSLDAHLGAMHTPVPQHETSENKAASGGLKPNSTGAHTATP